MANQPEEQPKHNGATALLSLLAQSSHQWVQLATVGLIALSGIGNWVATWNSADRNKNEIEVSRRVAWESEQRIREDVRQKINEIHQWMSKATDEFHKGNADSAANRKTLSELHDMMERLERFKRAEQLRGAPP